MNSQLNDEIDRISKLAYEHTNFSIIVYNKQRCKVININSALNSSIDYIRIAAIIRVLENI